MTSSEPSRTEGEDAIRVDGTGAPTLRALARYRGVLPLPSANGYLGWAQEQTAAVAALCAESAHAKQAETGCRAHRSSRALEAPGWPTKGIRRITAPHAHAR